MRSTWPESHGVRVSFLATEIGQLVQTYPAAKLRFAQIRDVTAGAAAANPMARHLRLDWIVLNATLGDDQSTLSWFDGVKDDPRFSGMLQSLATRLAGPLKRHGRWADAGRLYADPVRVLKVKHSIAVSGITPDQSPPFEEGGDAEVNKARSEQFRREAAELCASLRAAGRTREASTVENEALRLDPSRRMQEVLEEAFAFYGSKNK